MKPVLADMITVSRIPLSLLLLGLPVSSYRFTAVYLLCGLSDVLDGFAARRLHTESEKGARLDSAADLLFAAVYAVKILPHLLLPLWIWIWIAVIAAVKLTAILLKSCRERKLSVTHSPANKITGFLLFLLPLTVRIVDAKYSAIPVCATATLAAMEEICKWEKCKDAI